MDLLILQRTTSAFLKELTQANHGKHTSLPFIINPLPSTPLVLDNDMFQVLVIGGSICKSALVKKQKNKLIIIEQVEKAQPAFKTKEDLFFFIEENLEKDTTVLAFNFAYPLTPIFTNNVLDGMLLKGSKENEFHGLTDKQIGKEITGYFLEKHKRNLAVSTANDTICLLLSGLTKAPPEHIAAGIVGTGLNFAFFLNKNEAVNLESARFDKFPKTREGEIIDKESTHPGNNLFEKEISGAYLYKHFNEIIKIKNIDHVPLSSTKELSLVATQHTKASKIAQELFRKSAQLVACQIGGITAFKKQDMTLVMEGSIFWKGHQYKETVAKTVRQLIPEYTVQFVEIQNSPILGAAQLVS